MIEKKGNEKMNKKLSRTLVALVIVSLCAIPMAGSNGGVLASAQTPPALMPFSPSTAIPTPETPSAGTINAKPTFQWVNTGAQLYQIQVYSGSKRLYTYNVYSYSCGYAYCTFALPKTLKVNATYTWYVWGYFYPYWSPNGPGLSFTVYAPFKSTFKKNMAGWYPVNGNWFVSGGFLQTPGSNATWANIAHTGIYDIYTYEASVYLPNNANNGVILYFNGSPSPLNSGGTWNNGYALDVWPYFQGGVYLIAMLSGGDLSYLVNWTSNPSLFNPTGWNILGVTYNTLTHWSAFYINYILVASGPLSTFTNGQVGIAGDLAPGNDMFVDYATLVSGSPAYLTPVGNNPSMVKAVQIDDKNVTSGGNPSMVP